MRLLSVNGNKRFFLSRYHKNVLKWLEEVDPDVVTVQEPWVNKPARWWKLQNYHLVGASDDVLVWSKPHVTAAVLQVADHRVAFKANGFEIHAVHLDPYKGTTRRNQLKDLQEGGGNNGKPMVVVGDFNLAPRPQDGRFGNAHSTATGADERRAFDDFLGTFQLVDATRVEGVEPEFTFERKYEGQWFRGRCDLALLPSALEPDQARAVYDHEVRTGPGAFTDHSAIVVDLPDW
ncbi:MAG TPA: endonuclease/exonuclease/phosphatase family protein [Sneathiellales bacterium]|nr:endonuclease/exonuclease/phosphatase family protein [Sneathiellales bacterium]